MQAVHLNYYIQKKHNLATRLAVRGQQTLLPVLGYHEVTLAVYWIVPAEFAAFGLQDSVVGVEIFDLTVCVQRS